jgi:ubiquinone/menaquinone biosynthesis C-methylase UbiE
MVMADVAGASDYDAAGAKLLAPLHEFIARSISDLVPTGGHLLDLGCASASLLVRLATARPDVTITGVDLSEAMLELGEANIARAGVGDRVRLLQADVTSVPAALLDDAGAVSCSLTLHHLPDAARATRCLRQLARVRARRGSAIWIFDFCRLRDERIWPIVFRSLGGGRGQFRADAVNSERAAFTAAEMRSMLEATGLRLHEATTRPLPVFQAHWASQATAETPAVPRYLGARRPARARLLEWALRG